MTSKEKQWLDRANLKLKGCGISLEMSGKHNNLYIRGMIPGRPWEGGEIKQRRLSLRKRVLTIDDVKEAEVIARQIALDLNKGHFDWSLFGDYKDPNAPKSSVGEWVDEFERLKRPTVSDYTWRYSYQYILDKLPRDAQVSEAFFIDWIQQHDPEVSTSRRKYLSIAISICEMAGVSRKSLDALSKGNVHKPVNIRNLPTDEDIEARALRIQSPHWKYVYCMLSTYGLRPHEIFRIDTSDFPDIRVLPNSKTGERLVPPIHERWIQLFDLTADIKIPPKINWSEDSPNWYLGRKISNGFAKHCLGDAYSLRHAFVRRCLEVGLSGDLACKILGHSREVFDVTYQAWISNATYLTMVKNVLDKTGSNTIGSLR